MSLPLLLTGGRVVTPDAVLEGAAVWMAEGRIVGVGPEPAGFEGERRDVEGALVVPGLIDTHLHGGLEDDVMDASPAALEAIARHLARHGVTGWLPTTVACPAPELARILAAIAEARAAEASQATPGARILGAHLESNFLAPQYKGAQPEANLRPTDDAALNAVLDAHASAIALVTLAPELPGALALIRRLVAAGVRVAVGHTDATYDQVLAACEAGASRVTHWCNAQRGFHHREPGVVGAALVCDALYAEVIADLVHVHPAGLEIARRCKGAHKLMLVSDALRGTGLAPGRYELGGQETTLDGTVARLADGTIAGSTITLERALAHVAKVTGASLPEAVAMATSAPAASLGLFDRGALLPGLRADLAVFDADFRCLATVIGGRWAFDRLKGTAPAARAEADPREAVP